MLLLLKELGAEVTGYSLPSPTTPSMFDLLKLQSHCHHNIGDIRDLKALELVVQDCRPEIVIHMAAQPLVKASYADPVGNYATNVMGTVNLLDACRRAPAVRGIVNVTTDKCYRNTELGESFVEDDHLGGFDPYSNSKACSELVTSAYRDSFFSAANVGVATARAGNVIGGGDFAEDRLVPDAIRAFASDSLLKVRNRLATRPWQHVMEPIVGYLLLAERVCVDPAFAEGWNFGPNVEDVASVEEVITGLVRHWGNAAKWEQDSAEHPHEAQSLTLNCQKAHERLGWQPKLSLDQALGLSVDWYHTWQRQGDLLALSKLQLTDFLEG
jgi:CDP-glucose 4,6-dehydratase